MKTAIKSAAYDTISKSLAEIGWDAYPLPEKKPTQLIIAPKGITDWRQINDIFFAPLDDVPYIRCGKTIFAPGLDRLYENALADLEGYSREPGVDPTKPYFEGVPAADSLSELILKIKISGRETHPCVSSEGS